MPTAAALAGMLAGSSATGVPSYKAASSRVASIPCS